MKKQILGLLVIVTFIFTSCNNTWYEMGHINELNECEFIVNDSISIIGKEEFDGDYGYRLFINGKQIMVKPSVTFNCTNNSIESVINKLEYRYTVIGTKDEFGYKEPKNGYGCFKFN